MEKISIIITMMIIRKIGGLADFLPVREARSRAACSPFDNLTETLPSVVRNDSKKK